MGKDTSIYMFDSEKAAVNLYEDLQHRMYHTQIFRGYINNRKKALNNDKISFDRILETIKNDINNITPEDMLEITLFFRSQIEPLFHHDSWEARNEYFETLYQYLGIFWLYEFPNAAAYYGYMHQYENYTEFFPVSMLKNYQSGIRICSEDFLLFNDYVILVTKEILDRKIHDHEHKLTEEEERTVNTIKKENQDNSLLFEIIEQEVQFLAKVFYPSEKSPYSHSVLHSYSFFRKSIEMKSRIDAKKNPKILILQSY